MAGADNKAYHVRTALVHAAESDGFATGPRLADGYLLYTVNNIQVPLRVGDLGILPGNFDVNFVNFL